MSDRIPLWQSLMAVVMREAPWTGLGYYAASRIWAADFNPGLGNAHSTFFEILLGGGIIGRCVVGLCVFFSGMPGTTECREPSARSDRGRGTRRRHSALRSYLTGSACGAERVYLLVSAGTSTRDVASTRSRTSVRVSASANPQVGFETSGCASPAVLSYRDPANPVRVLPSNDKSHLQEDFSECLPDARTSTCGQTS